ncbi:MAG TPA: hypothetical protein PLH65_02590 [bacterium]|nr:hypothetical protein [bacterium]HPN67389.1 hypothetical protein [bacterium]
MFIQKLVVFLLFEAVGLGLLIKTDPLVRWVGRIGFAERIFGPTGTYAFLRLFGGLLMFCGLIYVTGTWDRVLEGLFGWMTPQALVWFN